jgi:hypothetical protein
MDDALCGLSAVSIHAPLWGATRVKKAVLEAPQCFNPRSPCEERPVIIYGLSSCSGFQSTLPVWGATALAQTAKGGSMFQSTLPVWGTTLRATEGAAMGAGFNPRSRVGSDRGTRIRRSLDGCFNPRSLRGSNWSPEGGTGLFQSTLQWVGSDSILVCSVNFVSIHAPCVGSDGWTANTLSGRFLHDISANGTR